MKFLGALYLSLAAGIWGGMYVVSKYMFDYIPPMTLIWVRYVIAFITLYCIIRLLKQQPLITKKDWLLFIWIGFIGYFVSIAFQFLGTKYSSAHAGSLITAATPVFVVVFARWFLKEKVTMQKVIALFIALVGVVMVIGLDEDIVNHRFGNGLLVIAAITWALLSVFVKIASAQHSSLVVTTYAILFALIFTTPFMIWEVSQGIEIMYDPWLLFGVLYVGIASTAGAFFLWNKGIEIVGAGTGSLFMFLQPLVGTVLGWLILHEQVHMNFFIGGAFILFSVILATVRRKV